MQNFRFDVHLHIDIQCISGLVSSSSTSLLQATVYRFDPHLYLHSHRMCSSSALNLLQVRTHLSSCQLYCHVVVTRCDLSSAIPSSLLSPKRCQYHVYMWGVASGPTVPGNTSSPSFQVSNIFPLLWGWATLAERFNKLGVRPEQQHL